MFATRMSCLRTSTARWAILVSGLCLMTAPALAQQVADASGANTLGASNVETVVVTGTAFNPDAAPAKASLDTVEPQTIINKSYISEYMDPQADYVSILAIVPGMTGGDANGPGLSDGGAKNTLRGLPDGDFVMAYDGIPFGDTNGPTHHNISYFSAADIGSIVVDRGPGNAGNLGAATYGGTVKMFSETLRQNFAMTGTASYGSFGTSLDGVNIQTGDIDVLGTTARALVVGTDLQSDGALSLQNLIQENALVKVEDEVAPGWTVTLFGTYTYINEHLSDNNGLTPAQVAAFGKDFSLQNTNPNLPTYQLYNLTRKQTDMDYVRVNGELFDGLKIEDQVYTYSYWNHTFSPNSQTQTAAQILAGTSGGNAVDTLDNGTKTASTGILSYDKQNAYRVYGNVLRLTQDYDFGWLKGEVRAGFWWEAQNTARYKFYFDAQTCNSYGLTPYLQTMNLAEATQYCGAKKGSVSIPTYGYGKELEFTRWHQNEPFVEVDLKPTDDLTITPGFKYIQWFHGTNSPMEQGSLCGVGLACTTLNAAGQVVNSNTLGQNYVGGFETTHDLPFLTVNYKIQPSWSVYFEYAQGIYIPDISSFENSTPTQQFPAPETTTNYQFGTVYYADNFTLDGDIYYIGVNNNYSTQNCSYDITETCYINTGAATYKGIEAEGTYAFHDILGMDVTGLSVFANGALMTARSAGKWLANAPNYTAALGVLYKNDEWKFALIDKLTGQAYNDTVNLKYYELPAYNNLNAVFGYTLGNLDFNISADNLLNSRQPLTISENTTGVAQTNPATSLDLYQFQAPTSFMFTLRAHL